MSRPTVRALAAHFSLEENKVAIALADTIAHAQPWYVMALTGFGTWVGALLLALGLFMMGVLQDDQARVFVGIALMIAAACASRIDRGVVATQVALIGSVTGQMLVLSAFNDDTRLTVGLLVELGILVAVDRPITRGFSALAFFGFVLASIHAHDLPADAFPVAMAVVAAGAWLNEGALLRTPLAVGVRPVGTAAVVALCGFLLFEATVMSTHLTYSPFRLDHPPAVAVVLGVVCAAALAIAARAAAARKGAKLHVPTAVVSLVALVVGVLLSLEAPGIVGALLVITLGVHARVRVLLGIGVLFLFCFLALTYYRLDVTLTAKALWAGATGGLVLVVRAFVLPAAGQDAWSAVRSRVSASSFVRERKSNRMLAMAVVLALAVPVALIAHKERVLSTGERVLLALEPRDPRSLLQGDYMELRTVVAREALAALTLGGVRDHARSGGIVVRIDADRVATFVRIDDGKPLASNERRVKFRVRGNEWFKHLRIGAEELFFEEGAADHFAQARYGELVVDADGDTVLVGVRDAQRQPL